MSLVAEQTRVRVLAALKCVDAVTGAHINTGLSVRSEKLTVIKNPSGYFVLLPSQAFTHYQSLTEVTDDNFPALAPYSIHIADAESRYVEQKILLDLPLSPLKSSGEENSVFDPIVVQLFPGALFNNRQSWCVIRMSLRAQSEPEARFYPGAYIRLTDPDNDALLAEGFSDHRGEALLVLADLPRLTFSDDEDEDSLMVPYIKNAEVKISISNDINSQTQSSFKSVYASEFWPIQVSEFKTNTVAWLKPATFTLAGSTIITVPLQSGKSFNLRALI